MLKPRKKQFEKGTIDKKISDTKKVIDTLKKGLVEIEKEKNNRARNDNTKTLDSFT